MGHRLSKIYTRTGDDGSTGLGDGSRVSKDNFRVIAYGTVDELNSQIGVLRALTIPLVMDHVLSSVQHRLFDLGGELSIPTYVTLNATHVEFLEKTLDEFNAELPPLKEFILPGGNLAAATCHVARSVCRRAERCVVTLQQHATINIHSLHYLNRLSDLLFVFARVLARQNGGTEVLWQRDVGN